MLKTLMPYPHLSYGFSLILQINTYFYSPIYDSCILCELQVNRGEKKSRKLPGTLRRPYVAMSGQREEEVNKWPTSRRLNVATPQQRRDASTS